MAIARRVLVTLCLAPALLGAQGGAGKARTKGTDTSAVVLMREAYSYSSGGRRDPFVSLMTSGEVRPLLTDLALLGVIYDDETPRRSVAILTDGSTGQMYRVSVGATVGRMKVARIGRSEIVMSLDEFGLSRQQTLVIDKTPKDAGKANQPRRTP